MPQNVQPIFVISGDPTSDSGTAFSPALTLAANDVTGAGANNQLVYTASVNGSFIQKLRIKPVGTNSAASLLRIFLNNGLTNTTPANNTFWDEVALPVSTISTTSPMPLIDYPMSLLLPPNFRIYVGLTVAGTAGWNITPIAGEY